MAGQQIFLAAATVAELRYGALVAGWGNQRRQRLEQSIAAGTVVPVSDALLTTTAELRHTCRQVGHALHEPVHANDLWIAASAVHIRAPLLTGDAVFEDVPGLSLHR
jgi:tRNA(fMet)-specific endonuclease VapC